MKKITYNRGKKFDIQLSDALINEKRLGEIFEFARIEKIELKSESYQWEITGNIAIEYKCDGKPSGISVTEANYWVHELKRDGDTLMYLMIPIDRLKSLVRQAIRKRRFRRNAGDDGRFTVAILSLRDLLK